MASMCERAEELGGACRIERRPEGGVRVLGRLPINQDQGYPLVKP